MVHITEMDWKGENEQNTSMADQMSENDWFNSSEQPPREEETVVVLTGDTNEQKRAIPKRSRNEGKQSTINEVFARRNEKVSRQDNSVEEGESDKDGKLFGYRWKLPTQPRSNNRLKQAISINGEAAVNERIMETSMKEHTSHKGECSSRKKQHNKRAKKLNKKIENKDEERDMLSTRALPSTFKVVMNTIVGNKKKVAAVNEMGFGYLFDIDCTVLNLSLLKWMVSNIDPYKMTLSMMNGQSLEIKAEDVNNVIGLPIGSQKINEKAIPKVKDAFLERWKGDKGVNKEKLYMSLVEKEMVEDEDGGDFFKWNFIVFLTSRLIAPTNRATVNYKILEAFNSVSEIPVANWAEFVVRTTGEAIRRWKTSNKQKGIGGCLYFLQMLYLDRVMVLGSIDVRRVKPTMKGWENHIVEKRLRDELEKGGYGQGILRDAVCDYELCEAEKATPQMPHVAGVTPSRPEENSEPSLWKEMEMFMGYLTATTESFEKLRLQMTRMCQLFPDRTTAFTMLFKFGPTQVSTEEAQCTQFDDDFLEKIHEITQRMQEEMKADKVGEMKADEEHGNHNTFALTADGDLPEFNLLTPQNKRTKRPVRKKYKAAYFRSPFMLKMATASDKDEIAEHAAEIVDYALRTDLGRENLFVVPGFLYVSREEFVSLAGGVHVHKSVLAAWAFVLNVVENRSAEPKRFWFHPYMMATILEYKLDKESGNDMKLSDLTALEKARNLAIESECRKVMRLWLTCNRNRKSLPSYMMLFIPITHDGIHFVVCINFETKKVEVHDHMKQDMRRYKRIPRLMALIFSRCLAAIKHPSAHEFISYEWVFVNLKWKKSCGGYTYLGNERDSGVFAMKHIELYRGEAFDSDIGPPRKMEFYRYKIAAEILLNDSNALREAIIENAA